MLTWHLASGAEMQYMDFHWIYMVDMVLFPEGTTMFDHFTIYTPDAQKRYTLQAVQTDNGWSMKDLNGLMLTNPGMESWDHSLSCDENGQNWTLKLAFKKYPAAVMR